MDESVYDAIKNYIMPFLLQANTSIHRVAPVPIFHMMAEQFFLEDPEHIRLVTFSFQENCDYIVAHLTVFFFEKKTGMVYDDEVYPQYLQTKSSTL